MQLLVTISDGVYNATHNPDTLIAEVEREVNCLLDDAFSPHIKVELVGGNERPHG